VRSRIPASERTSQRIERLMNALKAQGESSSLSPPEELADCAVLPGCGCIVESCDQGIAVLLLGCRRTAELREGACQVE
jgi:hypothetical protein